MSVVRRLIDMHGGPVTAASAGPGHGSTFEVSLPTIAAPRQGRAQPSRLAVEPRRVLVVDDNVDGTASLVELLRLEGHQAEAVHSAKGALEAIAKFSPDVVLLDIGLPDMDGYEVAKRIRAGGNSVRLIALTGYGQAKDIERTHSAGFDAHLVKPVDFVALEQTIAGRTRLSSQAIE